MRCPQCQTEHGYYRQTTKEWMCLKCGIATPREKIEAMILPIPNV